MPADTENPEPMFETARLRLASGMHTPVMMCRRCGVLLPPNHPNAPWWDSSSQPPTGRHEAMHDALDSIAAILEQHREVMDRDG